MTETEQNYQVLARKYRPETFSDLVGQDAMVRTLKNAFAASRIAQAFIMTGIRGTGKTTTARIIAKGMESELGKPVVVVNKAGGSGGVGMSMTILGRVRGWTATQTNFVTAASFRT